MWVRVPPSAPSAEDLADARDDRAATCLQLQEAPECGLSGSRLTRSDSHRLVFGHTRPCYAEARWHRVTGLTVGAEDVLVANRADRSAPHDMPSSQAPSRKGSALFHSQLPNFATITGGLQQMPEAIDEGRGDDQYDSGSRSQNARCKGGQVVRLVPKHQYLFHGFRCCRITGRTSVMSTTFIAIRNSICTGAEKPTKPAISR
jgi:hypothetical protein